jgi:pyruvate formate lyase activating enzyme
VNDVILENLEALTRAQGKVVVRFPVIPGVNDDAQNVAALRKLLARLGLAQVHLLPYHHIGLEEYRRLELENRMQGTQPPSLEHLRQIGAEFERAGIAVKMGG